MATIINNRSTIATDPIKNFRFLVNFQPHNATDTGTDTSGTWATGMSSTMGFTSVSGLAVTTDSIPYREGGYNTTVHQIPGQTSFAPISLQRGVMLGNKQAWNWMKQLFQTVQSSTNRTANSNFRVDLEIQVLAHPIGDVVGTDSAVSNGLDDFVVMRFKVYNAWITSLAYSDLNAGDNAIMVEQMTLVHEGFNMALADNLSTPADDNI
jgi:phage tail-like protein